MKIHVAGIQMASQPLDLGANVEKAQSIVQQAIDWQNCVKLGLKPQSNGEE